MYVVTLAVVGAWIWPSVIWLMIMGIVETEAALEVIMDVAALEEEDMDAAIIEEEEAAIMEEEDIEAGAAIMLLEVGMAEEELIIMELELIIMALLVIMEAAAVWGTVAQRASPAEVAAREVCQLISYAWGIEQRAGTALAEQA